MTKQDNKIGSKIATLRAAHGVTVEELANRCGIDAAVLQDIENGAVSPSLAPLIKITRALGVRLGTLMDDDENLGPVITRSGDIKPVDTVHSQSFETSSDAGELTFNALARSKASRHMEPFYITLEPSTETEHELEAHEGEEWLYALEGPLEVAYGTDVYVLQPGDSIYYDTIVPHQVRSHKGEAAKFVACVYTPA